MQTIQQGYRAIGLIARLNADRLLVATVTLGALALGAQVATFL